MQSREEDISEEPVLANEPFREAVGCLMYLKTATRPVIAFAVNKEARKMENRSRADWKDVLRVLRYLRGTINQGIKYASSTAIKVYIDSDFAGELKTRRSTSDLVTVYGGGAISWRSQLQQTVALSTTEAELVAARLGN